MNIQAAKTLLGFAHGEGISIQVTTSRRLEGKITIDCVSEYDTVRLLTYANSSNYCKDVVRAESTAFGPPYRLE